MNAEGIPMTTGLSRASFRDGCYRQSHGNYLQQARLPLPVQPECPVTQDVCARGMWLHQATLLGTTNDMDDITAAALKISRAWQE